MKILLDMNIPLKYVDLLRDKGVECARWSDIGSANAADPEIMSYARNNDFIVMTCDLDFSTILSVTHELKPSIVQIRGAILNASTYVDVIVSALLQYEKNLKKGAILTISDKRARLRLLPV
ncbi:MAG: DUF5615 family PIN-like protein [Defluviitaleaceae bacterium]|nr:DUF5615 family PIN-like protein [Defluviitaleaceae bacterium]